MMVCFISEYTAVLKIIVLKANMNVRLIIIQEPLMKCILIECLKSKIKQSQQTIRTKEHITSQ